MGSLSLGPAFLFSFLLLSSATADDVLRLPSTLSTQQAEKLLRGLNVVPVDGSTLARYARMDDSGKSFVERRFGCMDAALDATFVETLFQRGKLSVQIVEKRPSDLDASILIVTPWKAAQYPVILFLHGFNGQNVQYSQLLEHIASHGYIVVAPQLSGEDDAKSAAAVVDWLSYGLQRVLPRGARPNLRKLALAGHSRGGHTAFAMVKYKQTSLKFSALLGIDPVGGQIFQLEPKVLKYKPDSLNITIPILVVGSGLEERSSAAQPCAPHHLSHSQLFKECRRPCYHFVLEDYGHMDMLDDDAHSSTVCVSRGGGRSFMRRSIAGLSIAFLTAYLENSAGDLDAIRCHPGVTPAKLNLAERKPVALGMLDDKEAASL